jgi:penicillin-binding protein 1A
MSDDTTRTIPAQAGENGSNGNGARVVPFPTEKANYPRRGLLRRRRPPKRFRIRKLRVIMLLLGLAVLAAVSTVFGMLMAVASELPPLEAPLQQNSEIVDIHDHPIGTLTGTERRIYLNESQIAPVMEHAIIAIEDRRFYTNNGVDLKGIARAAVQDLTNKKAVQGASTIPQQFVKLQLAAENNRTVFEKLREAALAYHLSHKWSKQRILRNYLNAIYFGNGAYGLESAARIYFSYNHSNCGGRGQPACASELLPQEAALLAGMVSSPSGYDPIRHPAAAKKRRDFVLLRMLQQGFLTRAQYDEARAADIPHQGDLTYPTEQSRYPYFTSWVKQQVVDQLGGGQQGAQVAFSGGLRVKTTIDSRLQDAAQQAISAWLPNPAGPRAALVAIHNPDGEVRAMVGGDDRLYNSRPFNLATQGQRQPGSSFKPFVLAEALRRGISPGSVWSSAKHTYILKGGERFTVNNFDNEYAGVRSLSEATTYSDNSVYVQVAMKVGPKKVARLARRMGIRTPVSHNVAIALGGLKQGVTPLDMAHAYETLAEGGKLTYGTLSPGYGRRKPPVPGPVGIDSITQTKNGKDKPVKVDGRALENHVRQRRVLTPAIAGTVYSILQSVVQRGTGVEAQIPGVVIAGKTGTTEDFGDAWFVGWTKQYTVAVWVGYPDKFEPMRTEYRGGPVSGGTFPAGIWKTFMESLLKMYPLPQDEGGDGTGIPSPTPVTGTTAPPAGTATVAPTATAPPSTGGTTAPQPTATPVPTAAPTTTPAPTTAPTTAPTPAAGTGGAAPTGTG